MGVSALSMMETKERTMGWRKKAGADGMFGQTGLDMSWRSAGNKETEARIFGRDHEPSSWAFRIPTLFC